jgi:hypothetical protein
MIPPFDENGYLPPGIHSATMDEIEARFGSLTEVRRAQMDSLRWLVDLARRAGAARLVVNGSFATDVNEPNDVDCVLLRGPGYPQNSQADDELNDGLPFIQLHIVPLEDFEWLTKNFFATDSARIAKGMLEVLL